MLKALCGLWFSDCYLQLGFFGVDLCVDLILELIDLRIVFPDFSEDDEELPSC